MKGAIVSYDFTDVNAQIECRAKILQFLGSDIDYPLYWLWIDRQSCYRLSYSQCEQLSEWLRIQCQKQHHIVYGKAQNYALPGQTVKST